MYGRRESTGFLKAFSKMDLYSRIGIDATYVLSIFKLITSHLYSIDQRNSYYTYMYLSSNH